MRAPAGISTFVRLMLRADADERRREPAVASPQAHEGSRADIPAVLHEAPEAPLLDPVRIDLGDRRREVTDRGVVGVHQQLAVALIFGREVELERAALVVD